MGDYGLNQLISAFLAILIASCLKSLLRFAKKDLRQARLASKHRKLGTQRK